MPARILVIEDHPVNLDLFVYLLEAAGYRTITAQDGRAGLTVARQERPDLIVCDILLPEVDGRDVARQLKADPELRAIPLLAVTAHAMVGDRDDVLAAGFDGYMSKPIDPVTFARQIAEYLPDTR